MDICMKAALLELMKENDFEKITVKQICERAGVNRGTFYSHYTDIYSMLNELEDYLSNELINITKKWVSDNANQNSSLFVPYLKYIKEHSYFYKIALSNRKKLTYKKTFKPLWEHLVVSQLKKANIMNEKHLIYHFVAFEGSVSSILQHWIETNCQEAEETISAILQSYIPNKFY